jgi:3-hydroxyacyl-CoA dehydrogenase
VEAACTLPFDQGMQREQDLFNELENSDEARALRYAFFAEREVARIPGLSPDVPIRSLETAAVVGAGTMGGGIAMSFADFGLPVRIMDATEDGLAKGMQRIRANYETSVKRGSLAADEMERRFARIQPVQAYEDIADADVVIEAVFEQMDVKKPIFAKLDAVMKPGALLLSNTSALDIDEIAAVTKRPQDVAGAHFFSPANVMKLLEVVRGTNTAPDTLASVMQMGKRIGKLSAVAGNTDGFVANRSRAPFNSEMVILLEEGALPEQVDKVMVDFGYPMGPFAVGDLAGLDVGYAGRQRRALANPTYRKLPIADKLVEMGRYGQKTGAGWYRYEKGDRTPYPDPIVADIIAAYGKENGIAPHSFTPDEILRRLLFSSVNEACKIIEEGFAYRAVDVDVMWLHGFGFPRYRGGLLFWADGIGARAAYDQIASWHQRYGERWAPSKLLRDIAEAGGKLREAKAP